MAEQGETPCLDNSREQCVDVHKTRLCWCPWSTQTVMCIWCAGSALAVWASTWLVLAASLCSTPHGTHAMTVRPSVVSTATVRRAAATSTASSQITQWRRRSTTVRWASRECRTASSTRWTLRRCLNADRSTLCFTMRSHHISFIVPLYIDINLLTPTVAIWVQLWSILSSLVVFDIRALWCSAFSIRVPRCQKLQWRINPV